MDERERRGLTLGSLAALILYGAGLSALTLLDRARAVQIALLGIGALIGLIGVRHPRLVLYVLALSVTIVPKDQLLADFGLAVTADRLLVGLLAAGLLLRLWRGGFPPLRVPSAVPAFALLVLAGIGLLHSLRPLEALLQQFYNFGVGLLVLAACGALLQDFESRRRVAGILCASAAYVAALGLWETANGRYVFPYEAMHYRGGLLRAASTLGNPVPFGAYLATIAPLAWVLLRYARGFGSRCWAGLCLGLILAGLALSFSRQAYLALFCGLLTMLAVRHGAARLALSATALAGAAVTTTGLWLGPVSSIFFDWHAISNILHRLYMSRVALQMLVEHPLLGVGLGSFRPLAFVVQPFGGLKSPHFGEFPSAHNSFLTVGAELGLPGLAVYLALFAAALLRAVRAAQAASGEEQALGRGCVGALLAAGVGALFLDSHEYLGLCTVFYFLIALGSGSSGGNHEPRRAGCPR